jgi:hypothetical protein
MSQFSRNANTEPEFKVRISHQLELGRAAEYLVCAELILQGWLVYATAPGVPYDLIVDTGRERLRVQVKSTSKPIKPGSLRISQGYFFNPRRAGRRGKRLYGDEEFDVYALVALDRRIVAFFSIHELSKSCIALRVPAGDYKPGIKLGKEFKDSSFNHALATWREHQSKRLTELPPSDGVTFEAASNRT